MSFLTNSIISILARFRDVPLSTAQQHRGERTLYMCGYPISGNSWTSYMLSYALNIRYDTADGVMTPQRRPLIPLLSGTNPHRGGEKFDCILKNHASPTNVDLRPNDAIVYIVRDGRDVVNSYFHRVEKMWKLDERRIRRIVSRLSFLVPNRIRYWMATRYFAVLWARQVEEALEMGVPLVRYEDVLDDPQGEIERLITLLDPEASLEGTAKAVELFTLEKMRASVRKANVGPVTDRVGRAGNWKEYFSPRDIKWFDRQYGDLMQRLGYDR